jgi:hypothetical protein
MNENIRNVNQGYFDNTANFINCFVWLVKEQKNNYFKKNHTMHTQIDLALKITLEFTFFLEFFVNNFIVLCHYLTLDVLDVISFFGWGDGLQRQRGLYSCYY